MDLSAPSVGISPAFQGPGNRHGGLVRSLFHRLVKAEVGGFDEYTARPAKTDLDKAGHVRAPARAVLIHDSHSDPLDAVRQAAQGGSKPPLHAGSCFPIDAQMNRSDMDSHHVPPPLYGISNCTRRCHV